MPDATHATHASPETRPNRYVEPEACTPPGGWISAALSAVTLGELADVVARAQAVGAFTDRDLVWARELWHGLDGAHALAWALCRRELGGTPLEDAPAEVAS